MGKGEGESVSIGEHRWVKAHLARARPRVRAAEGQWCLLVDNQNLRIWFPEFAKTTGNKGA